MSKCATIENVDARLRCYQSLPPQEPERSKSGNDLPSSTSQAIGQWRLIRTINPQGGKPAISITHPAELSGSDPNFAGIMIRCAEPDVEVLLVLLHPLALRARPRVTIGALQFEGAIAAPGVTILLPWEVAELAKIQWRSLQSLSLEIDENGTITRGIISLADFDTAFQALNAACSAR